MDINDILEMTYEARKLYGKTKDENAFNAYIYGIDTVRCFDARERGETEADGEDIEETMLVNAISFVGSYCMMKGLPVPQYADIMRSLEL